MISCENFVEQAQDDPDLYYKYTKLDSECAINMSYEDYIQDIYNSQKNCDIIKEVSDV